MRKLADIVTLDPEFVAAATARGLLRGVFATIIIQTPDGRLFVAPYGTPIPYPADLADLPPVWIEVEK